MAEPQKRKRKPTDHPLEAFAALSARDAQKVARAVERMPAFSPPRKIVAAIQEAIGLGTALEPAQLITALSSFVGAEDGQDPKELAARLSRSQLLDLPKNRRASFARNVERLLRSDVVSNFGKADDVITDHPRVFRSARILSDIRPVFGTDVSEPPTAAVIVEMLRIDHWSKRNERGSFYVALDHADLLKLRKVVDRAIAKTETLQQFLRSAGLTYYEHQEVSDEDASP